MLAELFKSTWKYSVISHMVVYPKAKLASINKVIDSKNTIKLLANDLVFKKEKNQSATSDMLTFFP